MAEEKRLTYDLPYGLKATFYSSYQTGFEPYPVTRMRCRFLRIYWLVESGKREPLIRLINGEKVNCGTRPLYNTKSLDFFLYREDKFTSEKT